MTGVFYTRKREKIFKRGIRLSSDIKFPDGVGFYPDIQEGVRGYNTDPARGADTFSPFRSTLEWRFLYNPNSGSTTYTLTINDIDPKRIYYYVAFPGGDVSSQANMTHVSAISDGGTYEDIISYAGYYTSRVSVIKVEKASSVTFTTRQSPTNSGVYFIECAVQ